MLSPEYEPYYQLLLEANAFHQESELSEMGMVEACFKSSLEHWRTVYRRVSERGFGSVAEEVGFFKEVKPAFGARIEYYTYRYHALLFAPVGSVQDIQRFWQWEQRKMENFFESNREFCLYMQEGATDRDEEYFRQIGTSVGSALGGIYDPGEEMSSARDYLVTTIRAYELYEKYILIKINQNCFLEA